jgi:HD-GYP domain-containing protein (c-di-GMP phosphodiesterase class II)
VPVLESIAEVVLHHHERFDGDGYPDGLRGDEIPLPARIVAVVDAYCAMITRRSYKEAYSEAHARDEIRRCAGSQFDPGVVDAFLLVLDTPDADDTDEDSWAECLVLPGLGEREAFGRAP